MVKVNPENISEIEKLSKKELEKLVPKAASNDKNLHDYLMVNYVDKDFGEKDFFEEAKSDIYKLFFKSYKGFSPQLRSANVLSDCIKRINEFSKICKNKNLEADLLVFVLVETFSNESDFFGTCFTNFDYKVDIVLKRLITLVAKKLHQDYLADYKEKVNVYLSRLKNTSSHLDFIYNLLQKTD
jgi:hypothetical protein